MIKVALWMILVIVVAGLIVDRILANETDLEE